MFYGHIWKETGTVSYQQGHYKSTGGNLNHMHLGLSPFSRKRHGWPWDIIFNMNKLETYHINPLCFSRVVSDYTDFLVYNPHEEDFPQSICSKC